MTSHPPDGGEGLSLPTPGSIFERIAFS